MARYVAAIAFLGVVLADGGQHAAPSASGYAAPAASYGAPTYDAPTYEAEPVPSYSYEGYEASAPAATIDGFDLDKITELIPLFIAVFAAIIIAQLVAPLFAVLFGAKVGLLGGIFAPLGQVKADLINAILNPLGFALGNAGATCTNAVIPTGRSLNSGFDVMTMIEIAQNIYGGETNIFSTQILIEN